MLLAGPFPLYRRRLQLPVYAKNRFRYRLNLPDDDARGHGDVEVKQMISFMPLILEDQPKFSDKGLSEVALQRRCPIIAPNFRGIIIEGLASFEEGIHSALA